MSAFIYRKGIVREHASLLNVVLRLLDLGVIALAAWLAHGFYLQEWLLRDRYATIIGVVLLLAALLFPSFHLYRPWRGISFVDEVRAVSLAWGSVLLGLLAFLFMVKQGAVFSRGWVVVWMLTGWLLLLLTRLLLRVTTRLARIAGLNLRHIVLVGAPTVAAEIVERLKAATWMGMNIVGLFQVAEHDGQTPVEGLPRLGGMEDLADYVAYHDIDQVWITLPLKDEEVVREVLHELRHSTVDIRYVPDLFGLRLLNHSITEIAGFPVLDLSVSPMNGINRVVKALEDRVLAFLILLLISPLMACIAIGVKLSSPGPVFYRQERVGWNGEPFTILKFRSMPVDVERNGTEWGNAHGKERTAFGAFLRRTSLDELPQFINVLRGEMSIVGPRPERTEFVEKFKDEIPDYMKKHLVKAGITGWAQVNGLRGDTDLAKRIEYDLYYIEHWSLWFDLKIILLTFVKGFLHKNAY